MSGFSQARAVESQAMAILVPFLQERAFDNRFVLSNKGPLARHLQEIAGDAMFNSDADRLWTVEIKAERRFTGNLFLETWSNRNLETRDDHAARGSNPGWLFKQRAELLFYYFLDVDRLYIIDFFRLKQWAFGHADKPANIWEYPERGQSCYAQMNDTWGRIVPIADIEREVKVKLAFPKQVEAFAGAAE